MFAPTPALVTTAFCESAGSRPGGRVTFFGAKKVTKETRPIPRRAKCAQYPALLKVWRRLRNSRCALRQSSPTTPPALSAARLVRRAISAHCALPLQSNGKTIEAVVLAGAIGAPSAPAAGAASMAGCAGRDSRRSADKAGRRISACPKPLTLNQRAGSAEAAIPYLAQLGRVSFGYFSLHEQRKVSRLPGRDPAMPAKHAGPAANAVPTKHNELTHASL